MKVIVVFLILWTFEAPAQTVNFDSLFAQAQRQHADGMRLSGLGKNEEARIQLNLATETFRDYQDGLQDHRDSITQVFARLLESSPESPVYNYLLGRIIQISRPDSARSAFANRCLNKAVELRPDYPWSYLALAYPYFSKGDYATASRYYEQSVGADSTFLSGYQQLITVYQKLGRSGEVAHIENLLNAKFPRSSVAIIGRLEKARRSADFDTKIRIFREAIESSEDVDLTAGIYAELLTAMAGKSPDSASSLAREVLNKPGVQYRKARQ